MPRTRIDFRSLTLFEDEDCGSANFYDPKIGRTFPSNFSL